MGYPSTWRGTLSRYDWEREYKGSHPRGDLSIPDYMGDRAEERRQEIERQIDTMMKRFVEHIDEQIDRLDESVDQVWQDTHEWNNIIRYLKTYSDDEYETLYKRAREPLDYLPEKNHMLQSLGDIIPTAQAENTKHIDLEISSIPEKRERMR